VLRFSQYLEENLIQLQNELIWKTYRTGRYHMFYVYEPKQRLVAALPFKDRVAQHALCNIIEPLFEATFIYDSYACRAGKGTHAGADRLTKWLRRCHQAWGKVYILKADVTKYFPSVDHQILLSILGRKIKCRDTMDMMAEILASSADPNDPRPKGIPVGNLTSQLWANVYLNEMDYFVKHTLREKFYLRYMDDFVILHHDKKHLRQARREIEGFLWDVLALKLNPKTSIYPEDQGVDFLGYRIWRTHRLVRKQSIKRMKRKLKKFQEGYREGRYTREQIEQTLASWLGHVGHANSYNLRKKLFGDFVLKKGDG